MTPHSPAEEIGDAPGRHVARFAIAALTASLGAALAGCGTAPLSFINDNQVYHRAVLHRYPVRVVAIDGSYTAFRPVPIAPGPHLLTIDAVPVAGFHLPIQKFYPLTVAPCTRYYIAAQRRSPLIQDWDLVVEETWPVAGCDPARELVKAKTAAISGLAAPTSSLVDNDAPRNVAHATPR